MMKTNTFSKNIILSLLCVIPTTAFAQSKAALEALKAQLIQEYPAEKVEVGAWRQGTYDLTVGFRNPKFSIGKTSDELSEEKARQIALFIKKRYPDIQHVKTIAVGFAITQTSPILSSALEMGKTWQWSSNFNVKKDLATDK